MAPDPRDKEETTEDCPVKSLHCTLGTTGDTVTITLSGEWRFGDTRELDDALKRAEEIEWNLLIINITAMTAPESIISTDFVAEMVRILKLVRGRDAHWAIVATSDHLLKVFELCRLGRVFKDRIVSTTLTD